MRRLLLCALSFGAGLLLAVACGTGAPPAGGDNGLPNALVGPFRVLRTGETPKTAPHILQNQWFGPAALDLDGDPSTIGVALYAVGPDKPYAVSRFELADGRSAPRIEKQTATLLPSADWEKIDGIANPFVMRAPTPHEVWMYYDSGGCLGRAVSSDDGVTFTKSPTPLLCGKDAPASWENGALKSPTVARISDGTYRLFYESNSQIGEMSSPDGVTFQRLPGPVLTAEAAPGDLPPDAGTDTFDDVAVGDPEVLVTTTALGRPVTYVFYTGLNRLQKHAVGIAARFGDSGPLTRNPTPALTDYSPHAPSIVRYDDFSMLYVQGPSADVGSTTPVINGAVAPATFALDPIPDASPDAVADHD
jgi:hypothetical protein